MKKLPPNLQEMYEDFLVFPEKAISLINEKRRLQKRLENVLKSSQEQRNATDNVINELFKRRNP